MLQSARPRCASRFGRWAIATFAPRQTKRASRDGEDFSNLLLLLPPTLQQIARDIPTNNGPPRYSAALFRSAATVVAIAPPAPAKATTHVPESRVASKYASYTRR